MRKLPPFAILLSALFLLIPPLAHAQAPFNGMKLLTDNTGWAAINNHLYWTTDFGKAWRDITPSGRGTIAAAYFLDPFNGWALLRVANAGGPYGDWRFELASTTDGGTSWQVTPVSIPSWNLKAYTLGGSATMDFVDAMHGWIDLSLQSSSAAAWGALLVTDDGGRNWNWPPPTRSAPGVFGSLSLLSPKFGWLAGGPGFSDLYVTRDGCQSWQRVQPQPPSQVGTLVADERPPSAALLKGAEGVRALYQVPIFTDSKHAFLPVTYFDFRGSATPAKLVIYATSNAGLSWAPIKVLVTQEGGTAGMPIPVTVTDLTAIVPQLSPKGKAAVATVPLKATTGGTPTVTPTRRGARSLSFVDSERGWAYAGWIYATADAGASWTNITPKPSRPGPHPPAILKAPAWRGPAEYPAASGGKSATSPLTAGGVPLEQIASCFEGIIPSTICSCSKEGTPNLTYLSIVHMLDGEHVGLSYQFFSKTRRNILENPRAQVVVVSPETLRQYRLSLSYERTETEGPRFERMKANLDAVASQTGMSQIFRLRGVDIYRVVDCRSFTSEAAGGSLTTADRMPELEAFSERLAGCGELDALLDTALEALATVFGIEHSFVMATNEDGTRLYTLASHGYADSGVGSEIWVGEGILGVAAERRVVVRTTSLARETIFSRAVRAAVERRGEESLLEKEIALPGLGNVQSQLVAPLVAGDRLLGVLCLQSASMGRFLASDERLIQVAARQLAATMAMLARAEGTAPEAAPRRGSAVVSGERAIVKHYGSDDSIFIDDAYLIKGVAGRILWKLVQSHASTGRVEFTNKEIRLDSELRLPDLKDNLEARLILLRRRLEARCEFLRLVRAGRGRFRMELRRQITLEEHK